MVNQDTDHCVEILPGVGARVNVNASAETIDALRVLATTAMKTYKIGLKSTFKQILGENIESFTEEERKKRWQRWIDLALKGGKHETVEVWTDTSGCEGCKHLNGRESWCNLMSLPCTVNPVLSFKHGLVGMACMGAGYEKLV